MKKPTILRSYTTIRFQDCDPFQHLSNSKYIDYMVQSREDQLKDAYQLDLYALAQATGQGYVTSTNQIAYLRPAWPYEKVQIESQVIGFDDSASHVELRMLRADGQRCKAVLWARFAFFDIQNQRAARQTPDLMALHADILAPVSQLTFDERAQYWRQFNRQATAR